MRSSAFAVIALLVLLAGPFLRSSLVLGGEECSQMRPLVLIYCQDRPSYGESLAQILEEDPRIDAETLVLSDADLFKHMLYFPNVKVVVYVSNEHRNEGLGGHLESFFSGGGGLVGMGFAGWQATTANASRTVFPLNATSYLSGKYDREKKAFTHNLYVDQKHAISEGLGNLTAYTQKIVMATDKESGALIPPTPTGKLTVVYREPGKNAPAVVAYEDSGVSVTFGGFAGDSIERAPTYYGLFTEQEEFRMLFTNSVRWVWENENRYDATLSESCHQFAAESADRAKVAEDAEAAGRRRANFQLARSLLVVALVTTGIAVVARTCFITGRGGSG